MSVSLAIERFFYGLMANPYSASGAAMILTDPMNSLSGKVFTGFVFLATVGLFVAMQWIWLYKGLTPPWDFNVVFGVFVTMSVYVGWMRLKIYITRRNVFKKLRDDPDFVQEVNGNIGEYERLLATTTRHPFFGLFYFDVERAPMQVLREARAMSKTFSFARNVIIHTVSAVFGVVLLTTGAILYVTNDYKNEPINYFLYVTGGLFLSVFLMVQLIHHRLNSIAKRILNPVKTMEIKMQTEMGMESDEDEDNAHVEV